MNYAKQIADMLGIEVEKEFALYKNDNKFLGCFYLTDKGICHKTIGLVSEEIINGIIFDNYRIEIIIPPALPIKCKKGDKYKYIDNNGNICKTTHNGLTFDSTLCALGNMFGIDSAIPTQQINEMVKKLKGE